MKKIVWQLDEGGYLAEEIILSKIQGDFREGGWVIPFGCTEVEPPKEKGGYLRKINGESWEYEKIPEEEVEVHVLTQQNLLDQLNAWLTAKNNEIASNLSLDLSSGLTLEEAQEYAAEDTAAVTAEYEEKLTLIQSGKNPFEEVQ